MARKARWMCNETEDVRALDGRRKAVAGDCWGWATPRGRSYASGSWTLSMTTFFMDSQDQEAKVREEGLLSRNAP